MSSISHPSTSNPPPQPPSSVPPPSTTTQQAEGGRGIFTLLLFANASTYLSDQESITLPAPTTLFDMIYDLERQYPGFSDKVLRSSQVVRNLDYVDVDIAEVVDGVLNRIRSDGKEGGEVMKKERVGQDVVINVGDEVGIVPPVSSG